MAEFNTYGEYVTSMITNVARIEAIEKVLDNLFNVALKAADNMDIEEYSLDDDQVKIKTVYRNIDDVQNAITNFEKMRNMYISRINGRRMVLRDWRSLRNY